MIADDIIERQIISEANKPAGVDPCEDVLIAVAADLLLRYKRQTSVQRVIEGCSSGALRFAMYVPPMTVGSANRW